MSLDRRKPLKRTALRRRTPLKPGKAALAPGEPLERSGWGQGPRKPLSPVSARRRRESAERAKVRAFVLDRDHGCKARALAPGPCASPFPDRAEREVHEVVPRGRDSTSWLNPDVCIAVCQVHHDWITDHPQEAKELGLLASAGPLGAGPHPPDQGRV